MNHFKNITIQKVDITTLEVDAIVNAANSSLLGGGGVDGAIHRIAGSELLEECRSIRKNRYPEGLSTGKAVLTKGYNLLAKYVIHTVGPIWNDRNNKEHELLANCYENCLNICRDNEIKSVAFPAISTGVYGYPKDQAVKIVFESIDNWLSKNEYDIDINFALMNDNYELYKEYFEENL